MVTYISNDIIFNEDKLIDIGENILSEIFDINSNIYISPSQISELCENIKSQAIFNELYCYQYLNESSNNNNNPSQLLDKIGIKNSKLKIDNAGKNIVNVIKSKGISEQSKEEIYDIVSKLFKTLSDMISKDKVLKDGKFEEIEKNKLISSLILVLWVSIVNSLSEKILSIFLTPPVGEIITAIVVGPLCEEASKQIALKGNFEKEYFIVFNILEAGSYIFNMSINDIPIVKAIRVRLICMSGHGLYTIIHHIFDSEKFRKKFHIDDESKENKATFTAYIITVLLHGTWNAAATFSKPFIKAITGLNV